MVTFMAWADEISLKVRTNADTPKDAAAVRFGAEGIGLCRTSTCSLKLTGYAHSGR